MFGRGGGFMGGIVRKTKEQPLQEVGMARHNSRDYLYSAEMSAFPYDLK